MALDIRMLWLISACSAFLPGILVLLVRKTYPLPLRRVMLAFGVANICLGTGWLFRVERALVGEFAFQVLSNTLFLLGAALTYLGICLLKGQKVRMVWMIGLPLLQLGSGVWSTVVHRNMSQGVVSALVLLAVFLTVMAATLQRKVDGERPLPDMLAAISLALMAAVYLGGAVVMVRNGQLNGDYDFSSPRVVITAIASAIMEATLTTLFLLMVSARLQRELAMQAMIDPLTELYNRRAFEEIARREVAGAARSGAPLSLIVVDLDRFKEINDEFGHNCGDAMLRHVALTLRSKLREEDFLCRWGGDEFCVLLPRCKQEVAQELATRLRVELESADFTISGKRTRVTGSLGVITDQGSGSDLGMLVAQADKALNTVKNSGRNGVACVEMIRVRGNQKERAGQG